MSIIHSVLLTISTLAQQPAPPAQAPVFTTTGDVDQGPAVDKDRAGANVRGLTRGEFRVAEDGRVQDVVVFSFDANPLPVVTASDRRLPPAASDVCEGHVRRRAFTPSQEFATGSRIKIFRWAAWLAAGIFWRQTTPKTRKSPSPSTALTVIGGGHVFRKIGPCGLQGNSEPEGEACSPEAQARNRVGVDADEISNRGLRVRDAVCRCHGSGGRKANRLRHVLQVA